jgi:hypothetical protein
MVTLQHARADYSGEHTMSSRNNLKANFIHAPVSIGTRVPPAPMATVRRHFASPPRNLPPTSDRPLQPLRASIERGLGGRMAAPEIDHVSHRTAIPVGRRTRYSTLGLTGSGRLQMMFPACA